MTLRAAKSLSLPDQVFAQLITEIVSKRYAPGSSLPAERALSETFEVNRHVVREAVKRLEQMGLVKVSQGGGTRVLDYREHAGLDLLSILGQQISGGPEAGAFWISVLEMRANIAPDLARLCALRGSREIKAELVAIAKQMSEADSDQALFTLEVRFWDRVLDGADNIAYRLAFNSMLKGVNALGDVARQSSVAEVKKQGYRVELARAIAAGDAEAAEVKTRVAMRAGVEAVAKFLRKAGAQAASSAPAAATVVAATSSKRKAAASRAAK